MQSFFFLQYPDGYRAGQSRIQGKELVENDTEDFWEGLYGGPEDVDIYFLMEIFSATMKSGFVLLVFVAGGSSCDYGIISGAEGKSRWQDDHFL